MYLSVLWKEQNNFVLLDLFTYEIPKSSPPATLEEIWKQRILYLLERYKEIKYTLSEVFGWKTKVTFLILQKQFG